MYLFVLNINIILKKILHRVSRGIIAWKYILLNYFSVAAGRAPNSKRLNLEAVGVEVDKAGAIKVYITLL